MHLKSDKNENEPINEIFTVTPHSQLCGGHPCGFRPLGPDLHFPIHLAPDTRVTPH